MKKLLLLTVTIVSLSLAPAFAQFGPRGGGQGPDFGGGMDKLFGANQTFSASLEIQVDSDNGNVSMPGKISFDHRKSRFEMNITDVKGSQMPASAAQQMKSMGLDAVISISRPELKVMYLIYPGLNSYAAMSPQNSDASTNANDFKVETAEIGKETVDGHACVKNKVTVTGKDGKQVQSTVWNASDLKNFPVKIVTGDAARPATMLFKNISFDKPDAALFEIPSGYTKYDNVQSMMQTEMAKKMGGAAGGMGMPPVRK